MGSYSRSSTLLRTTLFLVIGAIIASALFYVYRSNQNTSQALKSVGNTETPVQKPTAKAETAAPALNYVNN